MLDDDAHRNDDHFIISSTFILEFVKLKSSLVTGLNTSNVFSR